MLNIQQKTGVLEIKGELKEILSCFLEHLKKGKNLKAEFIPCSKNHNGKPMMVLYADEPNDISIHHLEISEEGLFPYSIDDSIS